MSPFGDDVSEMDKFKELSDRDIEALIAGETPAGSEELDGVAGFIRTAKAIVPEALDPAVEQLHLAAIVDAVRLMEPGNTRLEGSIRRKPMLSALFASLWMKVAAGAVAGVLATGGLAAAHVLPDPVQDAVESVAGQIGIDLSEDEAEEPSDIAEDEAEAAEEAAEEAEEAAEEAAEAADEAAEDAAEADEGDDDADEAEDESDDDADEAEDESDDDADEAEDESDDDADEAEDDSAEASDESSHGSDDAPDDESHDDAPETEESD